MQLLIRNWFMIALIFCLLVGYQYSDLLFFLVKPPWVKWTIVSLTMIAMTWPLQTLSIVKAARNPIPAIVASAISLILAPLLAIPLSKLLTEDLAAGLILAATVPGTLASAAVWTRRAGGNDTIAMMVTIITNTTCFIITPAWLFGILGQQIAGFDITSVIMNLLLFVVVPMGIGQVLRLLPNSASWATGNKSTFSFFAQVGILLMTLLGSIKMGKVIDFQSTGLTVNQLLLLLVMISGLHLALFFTGIMAGRITKQSIADQIAMGFSGSQKTLMVGLGVAVSMGLNIIPIVAYHALQLIIDTMIANRYQRILATDSTEE